MKSEGSASPFEAYPSRPAERDRWVLARRLPRRAGDPFRPHLFFEEVELQESGSLEAVVDIFLTNRECPWRCVMCDLWKHTLEATVPAGAIPAQIDQVLELLDTRDHSVVKLYNSGSFFDPRAIPPEDYPAIATRLKHFERVIVECHPALIGDRVLRFQDLLPGRLEVALGLETAHAGVLEKLHKRFTLEQYAKACEFLKAHDLDIRSFLMIKPPFMIAEESSFWTRRSIDFALNCHASAVSLIPTRGGNGAMEALREQGFFSPPTLEDLEAGLDYGVGLGKGRVFADLWDLELFSVCPRCFLARHERMVKVNRHQKTSPRIPCSCGAG